MADQPPYQPGSFEHTVIEGITELKTLMTTLVGPQGRVEKLEASVDELQTFKDQHVGATRLAKWGTGIIAGIFGAVIEHFWRK